VEKRRERNCSGGRNAGGELFEVGKRRKGLSGMGKDGGGGNYPGGLK